MVHIYYGFGKGKTSNLNGIAVRAIGARLRPVIIRFLKGRPTSEDKAFKYLHVDVINFFSQPKFIKFMTDKEKEVAKQDIEKTINFIKNNCNNYDVFLLDEFLDLVEVEMLTEDEMIDIIKLIPKEKEVLISGHYKLDKLFSMADLITHYENEKHYFDKGLQARDGIEK